jgi:hypothetical protein
MDCERKKREKYVCATDKKLQNNILSQPNFPDSHLALQYRKYREMHKNYITGRNVICAFVLAT